ILYVSSSSSLSFFFKCYGDHRDLHSFPTRRSSDLDSFRVVRARCARPQAQRGGRVARLFDVGRRLGQGLADVAQDTHLLLELMRSEEHTSELQSQSNLVCRLLLEKKKQIQHNKTNN